MRLCPGSRPPGGRGPVVTTGTITAGGNISMRERSRLPSCRCVTAIALRIASRRDMSGLLACRAHTVMAIGTTACRGHLAMIERGRRPPGCAMANAALLSTRRNMTGFQSGGTGAVVAVRTIPAADLLHSVSK